MRHMAFTHFWFFFESVRSANPIERTMVMFSFKDRVFLGPMTKVASRNSIPVCHQSKVRELGPELTANPKFLTKDAPNVSLFPLTKV